MFKAYGLLASLFFGQQMIASHLSVNNKIGENKQKDIAGALVLLSENPKEFAYDSRVLALQKLGIDWRGKGRCDLVYQYCNAVRRYAINKNDRPLLGEVLFQVALCYHHQAKYEDAWALFASIVRMPNIAQCTRARASAFLPASQKKLQASKSVKQNAQLQRSKRYENLIHCPDYWLSD